MDESERKAAIEKRFSIELQETPKPGVYRVYVDGVQQWFGGYPPALTLDQIEQVMRWLAENHMDWRE